MSSFNLKSHPDTLLIKHLKNVGLRCANIIETKDINFSYSKELLIMAARVMGYTHDLGKSTKYFQDYLYDMEVKGESSVDKTLRSHGYISALFTYLQLKDIDEKLALICFLIVRKHHGDLDNASLELNFENREVKKQRSIILEQLKAINREEFNLMCGELSLEIVEDDDVLEVISDIQDAADEALDDLNSSVDYEEYILFKLLFSALIYADKEDAIFKGKNDIKYDIPYNVVDTYKEKAFTGPINSIGKVRNSIYDDVLAAVKETNTRIMSITVPTGTGKTLTSISAALNLREKLKSNMRIIYCLPFTSVIDQNYDVYTKVLGVVLGEDKVTNERILKHHHLSETKYIGEDRNIEDNKGKFLIENWNSQVVVTTFMQFFNTLFSNKNSELVKYSSISNSIVLLDEIQSLPYKYWLVINKLFKIMAEKLNIYFILITATQPLIFGKEEIKELVSNNDKYFKQFKRTRLHINLEPIPFGDFKNEIDDLILDNENKNILIILNTIKSSQGMYEYIKKMDLQNTDIFFLSTGIVPKHRKSRIDNIRKSSKRKIVVSTQLIEAGVDIDMDIVVRDMAPLDSINQSAGRSNREYRGDYKGDVYIYNIINDNGNAYSKMVYDKFLISKTFEVLSEKEIVLEEDYLKLNKHYFSLVGENMSNKDSRELLESIGRLSFKDIKDNFNLIDKQQKISVYVEVDENAKDTWRKYEEIRNLKDPFKRREEFDRIKKDFYDNVINVFKNKVKDSEELGIVYVNYDSLSGSYDLETGYILEDKDVNC